MNLIKKGLFSALLVACSNNPQAALEKWNADFAAQNQACETGDTQACQRICEMSVTKEVCVSIKSKVDMNDPSQQARVTQCEQTLTMQGSRACGLAGMQTTPEVPLPAGTGAAAPGWTPTAPTIADQRPAQSPSSAGPSSDHPDPHKAREEALRKARASGIVGHLK